MTIPLVDIVGALQQQLKSIPGLRVHDFVPGTVEYPAAIILPPEIDYLQAFRHGVIFLDLEVVVLVAAVVDRQQTTLFGYLDWAGPQSIVAAIDADKTLGIPNIEAVVRSARQLSLEEIAGFNAWGAALRVHIHNTA